MESDLRLCRPSTVWISPGLAFGTLRPRVRLPPSRRRSSWSLRMALDRGRRAWRRHTDGAAPPAALVVAQRHQAPTQKLWRLAMNAKAWMVTRLDAPSRALEIQTVDVGEPGVNQVRVAVEAFCLDFNDIDTIRGRYGLLKFEPPFVIGMAAAGTVEAVGPGCEAFLGRRVVGTTAGVQGGYASAALLEGSNLQLLPAWLSVADGMAMYFPFLLSYLALRVRGRVAEGDVVLIHAAAGGAGSAAVQLAKAFGATVIATAGTDDKVELCRSLGADYGVNYRTEDFVAFVDDVTNGRGVDVAFDTVGGAVTTETFRVMAFNGRHLIV